MARAESQILLDDLIIDIIGIPPADGTFIVGNGTTWVGETGDTARTSMGVGSTDSPTFASLTLTDNLTVQGNTTLGSASPDTTTIRGQLTIEDATSQTHAVVFGSGANSANLYRTGNDELGTDDNFYIGGLTASRLVSTSAGKVLQSEAFTADGQLIIGQSGGGFSKATITAGTGITVTNGSGSITLSTNDGAIVHNSLSGLQGGTSGQYYHLTSAEYTGTGTGTFVRQASPTLTTPNIGAASGTSLNLSGLTASRIVSTDASKNLQSESFSADGQLIIGQSGGGFSKATITAGTGITVTNGSGSITLSTNDGAIVHNSLSGLQGGTSAQYYHLTLTEYTGTGTGTFVRQVSPTLTTPNIGVASGTSVTLSSLTSGRVVFTTTSGLLTDSANLTWNGSTLAVTGSQTISGNLTVDTSTLAVDAANNRVGIVNASPQYTLDVTGQAFIDGGANSVIFYAGNTASMSGTDGYSFQIAGTNVRDHTIQGTSSADYTLRLTNTSTGSYHFVLTKGNLTLTSGNAVLTSGNLTLSSGSITISNITDSYVLFSSSGTITGNNYLTFNGVGLLTLGNGTGAQVFNINGAALNYRRFQFQTNGVLRWQFGASEHAESGGNNGSFLRISAWSDTGVFIDNTIFISRSNTASPRFTMLGSCAWNGNFRIGSTAAPTVALDVTGAALISTTLGVTGITSPLGGISMGNSDNVIKAIWSNSANIRAAIFTEHQASGNQVGAVYSGVGFSIAANGTTNPTFSRTNAAIAPVFHRINASGFEWYGDGTGSVGSYTPTARMTLSRAGVLNLSGLTASRLVSTDGSKNLQSEAFSANGQLIIGQSGGGFSKATLTAGTGILITNGSGSITIASDSQSTEYAVLNEDWFGTSTVGTYSWLSNTSGAASVNLVLVDGNHWGVMEFEAIDVNEYASQRLGLGSIALGASEMILLFDMYIDSLDDVTHKLNRFIGLGENSTTPNAQSRCVGILYDSATSINWIMYTASGGTPTKTASSVAVATGWHRFKIVINSTATSVEFFHDTTTGTFTSLGTITTNIPTTTSNPVGPVLIVRKTNGSGTPLIMYNDYFRIYAGFTNVR